MSSHPVEACLALFNLSPGASYQEIRKVYLEQLRHWHPDRFEQHPSLREDALRVTQQLNRAFEILTDHFASVHDQETRFFFEDDLERADDWSSYYSANAATQTDTDSSLQPEDSPPLSQFESQVPISRGLFHWPRYLFGALFAPLFWLVDLAIYFCFERHSVLVVAAVLLLAVIY